MGILSLQLRPGDDRLCVQEGHISVLQLVLNQGADPLIQDHHGRDAYRVALR